MSMTLSWRTSALRRELWNGNSGQGASHVCHSPAAVPPSSSHLGGGGEVPVDGVLRRCQLVGGDGARHHAPAVEVPTLLQRGREQRGSGRHASHDSAGSACMAWPIAPGRAGFDGASNES